MGRHRRRKHLTGWALHRVTTKKDCLTTAVDAWRKMPRGSCGSHGGWWLSALSLGRFSFTRRRTGLPLTSCGRCAGMRRAHSGVGHAGRLSRFRDGRLRLSRAGRVTGSTCRAILLDGGKRLGGIQRRRIMAIREGRFVASHARWSAEIRFARSTKTPREICGGRHVFRRSEPTSQGALRRLHDGGRSASRRGGAIRKLRGQPVGRHARRLEPIPGWKFTSGRRRRPAHRLHLRASH